MHRARCAFFRGTKCARSINARAERPLAGSGFRASLFLSSLSFPLVCFYASKTRASAELNVARVHGDNSNRLGTRRTAARNIISGARRILIRISRVPSAGLPRLRGDIAEKSPSILIVFIGSARGRFTPRCSAHSHKVNYVFQAHYSRGSYDIVPPFRYRYTSVEKGQVRREDKTPRPLYL